jgi:hypothetical protein
VRVDLEYARALLSAAPLRDIVRAAARRARRRPPPPPFVPDEEARRLAADALGRAPRLFTAEPLDEAYRDCFPGALGRFRRRARAILDHRITLLGERCQLGPRVEWLRDPVGGRRADADGAPDEVLAAVLEDGALDAKRIWELQRAGHLVELAAAARLCPELRDDARAEIVAQMNGFLDEVRPGRGFAYASPLEVGLRAIHWLAAIELLGGARSLERSFVERCAGALLADLHWLWASKEDRAVAPQCHLLGDLVGAWGLALALDGAPGARPLLPSLQRAIDHEAARQVGSDGAHFEASTGYHRFALELLLVALKWSRSSGRPLAVTEPLRRMFAFLRGTLCPDGTDPGFGDSDDARVLPLVPRFPRRHAYLLPVGAALLDDRALRAPGLPFSEEALWLAGPDARRAWEGARVATHPPSASFPSGGVHVLRDRDLYVALRAGSYGQNGVGGHAHNDQLSLVVHVGGAPLIIDAGTGCYTGDPLLRDRLRATGAHSTVILDGAEQSPILRGRPFALPDRTRTTPVRLDDDGRTASMEAAHHGYRRLPSRALHRRSLTLHRELRVLLVEDLLDGRGEVGIEVRFLVAGRARPGAGEATRRRLERLEPLLGPLDPALVIELDGRAALVPLDATALRLRIEPGLASPSWQRFSPATLVAASARLTLSVTLRHALVLGEPT